MPTQALRLGKRLIGKADFVQEMESELLTEMDEKGKPDPGSES